MNLFNLFVQTIYITTFDLGVAISCIVQENLRFSAQTSMKIAPIRTAWQSHYVWSLTRSALL